MPHRWPSFTVACVSGLICSSCGDDRGADPPGLAGAASGMPGASGAPPGTQGPPSDAPAVGENVPGGSATPGSEGARDVSLPGGGLMAPAASSGEADAPANPGDGSADDPGAPAPTCALPTALRWASSPPLINPQPPAGRAFASLKDPSIVFFEGNYHVFATVYETTAGAAGWKSVYLSFNDLSQADSAAQIYMPTWATGSTVAPQVFYFEPQGLWYLIYQWGARYSTNPDIADPNGWSAPQPLLTGEPTNALDFWVICDDTDCHLFFSRDDGVLYKSKTPIGDFPSFDGYDIVMSEPSPGLLFEASNVYKVDGTSQYLLLVEAYGPRYFRSWMAESLDGPWAPLADTQQNPFAGAANVTFEGERWSDDISHGEMIRSGFDQRLTINGCNMQYLYQGTTPGFQGEYNFIPYRLGLLTQQ